MLCSSRTVRDKKCFKAVFAIPLLIVIGMTLFMTIGMIWMFLLREPTNAGKPIALLIYFLLLIFAIWAYV